MQPLYDSVLIRPYKVDTGVLEITDEMANKSDRGQVIAAGPGRVNEHGDVTPTTVKKGDDVIFNRFAFEKVKVDDEELYILSETDIIAILKPKK